MPGMIDFLTDATPDGSMIAHLGGVIESIPHAPSRIAELGLFDSAGLMGTTTLAFDQTGYNLSLVAASARGTNVAASAGPSRGPVVHFETVRLEREVKILSDETLKLRALGTSGDVEAVETYVQNKLRPQVGSVRATLEFHRLGALRGFVLDADASTVITNIYTKMGVTEPAPVYFDFGATSPAAGAIRKACSAIVRRIADALGGVPFSGVHAFVGPDFMDLLANHPETREVFLRQSSVPLAQGTAFTTFAYAGIVFEEYRGRVGAVDFVAADEARFFPVGVQGMFQQWFAPADREFLAGTVGLAEYALPSVDHKGRFREIAVQSNPVTVCTRPGALIGGFAGAAPVIPVTPVI